MGTKIALTYATQNITYSEENLYKIIGKKDSTNIKIDFIRSWKRYLDDYIIFWKYPGTNINDSHNLLQNQQPKIKFTILHNFKEQLFLNILITNQNGRIITDIYDKPTNIQQYIHFKSHHSKSCIKSIPYTLARWILTIVTNNTPPLDKSTHKNYA